MQLYDPTVTGPERNHTRAVAIQTIEGKKIGILENGKLNAVNMLQETALLFEQRHGCTIEPIYFEKQRQRAAPAETRKPLPRMSIS